MNATATAPEVSLPSGSKDNLAQSAQFGVTDLKNIYVNFKENSRKEYSKAALDELTTSILRHGGIYMPLIVGFSEGVGDSKDKDYTLISGFRRSICLESAAKIVMEDQKLPANERRYPKLTPEQFLTNVPIAILPSIDASDFHSVQLIENLMRENLNPIEIADAIEKAIMESTDDNGKHLTQAALADRLGKSESYVSQLRLIGRLPKNAKEEVSKGTITLANARLLLLVPAKFVSRALSPAKTKTAIEFEAYITQNWGTSSVSGVVATATGTSKPKPRTTRPLKEIQTAYIPELKRQAADNALDPKHRAMAQIRLDAINWVLNSADTETGKSFSDFEAKLEADKKGHEVKEKQESWYKRLVEWCHKSATKKFKAHPGAGNVAPTMAQCLEGVKNALLPVYNAEAKTVTWPTGKKDETTKADITLDVVVGDLDAFMAAVDKARVVHEKEEADKHAERKVKHDKEVAEKKAAEEELARKAKESVASTLSGPVSSDTQVEEGVSA